MVTASGNSKCQFRPEVKADMKPKMFSREYGHGRGLNGSANNVAVRMRAENPAYKPAETLGGETESGDLSLWLFKERPRPRVQFTLVITSIHRSPMRLNTFSFQVCKERHTSRKWEYLITGKNITFVTMPECLYQFSALIFKHQWS